MRLHPTRGYRECRNVRLKKTNRRVRPKAEHRKDYEASRLAARIGQLTARSARRTLNRTPGLSAGVGSTLFKIEPWAPSDKALKRAQDRHIHPRHKRPLTAIDRPR